VLKLLAEREQELIELARELIATPSPNPPGDERAVVEVARHALGALGVEGVRVVAEAEERPNLITEVGAGARCLILNGHVDTKPAGNLAEWETGPWDPSIRDGRLYGLGSTDMKAAIAAMIHAAAAIADLGGLEGILRLALVADEEGGSAYGSAYLAGIPELRADAVLVGEPTGITSGWEYVGVASRGVSCFRVRARGTQMHSSLSDRLPSVNASVELARVLARFADEFHPAEGATVNPGVTLQGGIFFGIYPGDAEFGVDVRTVPGMTLAGLQSDVHRFLGSLHSPAELSAEWVPEITWYPPSAIDHGHPLVTAAASAARDVLGREVPLGTMPAFTDGTHWSEVGIPTIPALGPGRLPLAHQPNEYVPVEEIVQAARIYALTALRYLAPG
jgi:acetylornithine deacetylase/succinyl-diaminopimelate desuccinylase-like protein